MSYTQERRGDRNCFDQHKYAVYPLVEAGMCKNGLVCFPVPFVATQYGSGEIDTLTGCLTARPAIIIALQLLRLAPWHFL